MTNITFLISAATKATAVLGFAILLALALRKQSSSARYFLWTCALAAALAVPALSLLVKPWNVAVPAAAKIAVATQAIEHGTDTVPASAPQPARDGRWLWALWAGGALLSLGRVALGHGRVRMMLARAKPAGTEWTESLTAVHSQLGIEREVVLGWSDETDVPLSYGFIRPEILLARDASEWTEARRRVVLTHELIHVKRWDALWSLLVQLACAVYWFHPFAWYAAACFRREQERSCDDAVVCTGIAQSDYAGHLVGVARSVTEPAVKWAAALCMARRWDLEQRVVALLDPRRNRRSLSGRALAAALAAAAICIVPLAAIRAQGQPAMTSLSGSVYDASGAAVPYANVLLKSPDGSGQEIAQADAAGAYKFATLRSGKYTMEVRSRGFAPRITNVTVGAGGVEHVDAILDLGQVSESVDVVGKGPLPVSNGAPKRIRVGGNVQATKLLKRVNPAYPVNLQSAGISGTVLLRAVISTSGDLLNLAVINTADAGLAQAATEAVSQWKYQPTLLNGLPVEVITTIAVNFKLEQ